MDGPDLSHLLDDANPERPSREVLDGIVRGHRRLQARRARTAATLGLVIALAGAGVGIGLSRQGRDDDDGVAEAAELRCPAMSSRMSASAPVCRELPRESATLRRVSVGSAPRSGASLGDTSSPSRRGHRSVLRAPAGCRRRALVRLRARRCAASGTARSYSPYGSIGDAQLRHLFTRTSDGVTVRAFTAVGPRRPSSSSPRRRSASTATALVATGPDPPVEPTRRFHAPTRATPVSCALTQALVVEVSDAGAVGVVRCRSGRRSRRPIDVLSDQVVGVAERLADRGRRRAHDGPDSGSAGRFSARGQGRDDRRRQWAVLVHRLRRRQRLAGPAAGAARHQVRRRCTRCPAPGRFSNRPTCPGSGATGHGGGSVLGAQRRSAQGPRCQRVGFSRFGELGRVGIHRAPGHQPRPPSPAAVRRDWRPGAVPVGQTVVIEDDRKQRGSRRLRHRLRSALSRVSCGRSRSVAWTGPPPRTWRRRPSPARSGTGGGCASGRTRPGTSTARRFASRAAIGSTSTRSEIERASRRRHRRRGGLQSRPRSRARPHAGAGGERARRCALSWGSRPKEAARSLGIAEGTVRKQLGLARDDLRSLVEEPQLPV